MASVLVERNRERAPAIVEAHPHRWALSAWARGFRRLARPQIVTRHVRRFCQPFELVGLEQFERLTTPAVIIANHTSHFDTLIVLSTLPQRLFDQVAVAAAADRFYTDKRKAAWYSLRYNAFPITRGGGRAALDYSQWLLRTGRSLLIFPEGTRSRTGELLPFHPGPALLAMRQGVPVLPISIQGAANILPPGTPRSRPASVHVQVGEPLIFSPEQSVAEATARMEAAMRALAGPQPGPAAAPQAPARKSKAMVG